MGLTFKASITKCQEVPKHTMHPLATACARPCHAVLLYCFIDAYNIIDYKY